ncbi:DUF6787 family protein [Bacteroidota bacterium]
MNLNHKKTIDLILILIVFTLTGFTAAYLTGIIMNFIGAESWSVMYILGYLIIITPIYQVLLLIYAFVFGKFNWFYSRQKKIIQKIISIF